MVAMIALSREMTKTRGESAPSKPLRRLGYTIPRFAFCSALLLRRFFDLAFTFSGALRFPAAPPDC